MLQAQGTLPRMVTTELVDLAWIGALALTLVSAALLAARLLRRRNPRASRRLYGLAPWTALAPALDLIENTLSLAMLAEPADFPGVLAPLHAGVSWLKLVAIVGVAVAVPAYALIAALTGGRLAGGTTAGGTTPSR